MGLIMALSGIDMARFGLSSLALIPEGLAMITSQYNRFFDKNYKPGIEGIVFDMKMTENASYSAQVTDHYTEDNYAIQDHIAIEPVKLTLTGKVAELVYKVEPAVAFAQAVIDRLTPLGTYSPTQALHAQQAIANVLTAQSVITESLKIYQRGKSLFGGEPYKNNQQRVFQQFEDLFYARTLLNVETPWRSYKNMIIENWSADQDETTTLETTFSVSLKQLRLVGVTQNTGQLTGRIGEQKSAVMEKGTQSPSDSVLYKLTN